jgi:hypothetical protein
MMKGLDYHHDNFMNIINRLAEVDLEDEAGQLKSDLLVAGFHSPGDTGQTP